jgi:RES domain-containing protein
MDSQWRERGSACSIRGDPREWNLLLNPAHADFARIEFRDPEPFEFDVQMFR